MKEKKAKSFSELLRIGEAASLLGVSETTIDRWARDGREDTPKPVDARGRRRWRRNDLEVLVSNLVIYERSKK